MKDVLTKRFDLNAVFIVVLCGLLLPPTCFAQKASQATTLSKEQWRQDLQVFARELPKRHKNLFYNVPRERFEKMVQDLDAALPSLEADEIVVRMQEITARVGDAHTVVVLPEWFRVLPLRVYWFGDELRVTHINQAYKQALGARVVKVGDRTAREARERLVSTVLSELETKNEWYVLSVSAGLMSSPEVLRAVGVARGIDRVPFTFEDDAGGRFTLEIESVKRTAETTGAAPSNAFLAAAKEEPLFRQRPGEEFWFVYLPESQTVYVNFRRYPKCGVLGGCREFEDVLRVVDERKPARLVFDMRQNFGGDSSKVRRHLIPAIRKRAGINQKGRLFVVTGRRTFSAALWNAVDFKKQTNAIIVGEPPGERPNGYSENDELVLPNSRLVVSYSTKYYRFVEENVPAFMPDKLIPPDWESYKVGRDPVMEWILSYRAGSAP